MADEVGPVTAESVDLGTLPGLLSMYFQHCVEVSNAATPWLTGNPVVPLAQLEELGRKLGEQKKLAEAIRAECWRLHKEIRASRQAAA